VKFVQQLLEVWALSDARKGRHPFFFLRAG
jgi:hypothetical protein